MPRRKGASRLEKKQAGRELAAQLRAQGLTTKELFAELTRQNVAHMEKMAVERGRCMQCWHSARDHLCICADLEPVSLHVPVRILVWSHARDYLNAGDDAKLLRCVTGAGRAEILLFGTSDDDKLAAAVRERPRHTVLLFPDETAVTIDQFKRQVATAAAAVVGDAEPEPDTDAATTTLCEEREITVIVLNGTSLIPGP